MIDRDEEEVDQWIDRLRGPLAPEAPPDVRRIEHRRAARSAAIVSALAASALLALYVGSERGNTRGLAADETVQVELRVVVDDDGRAERLRSDAIYTLGQSAYFRVSASAPAEIRVWVDGPAGREPIGRTRVEDGPATLADAGGYRTYLFESPGRYVFTASTTEACAPPSCDRVAVEVR